MRKLSLICIVLAFGVACGSSGGDNKKPAGKGDGGIDGSVGDGNGGGNDGNDGVTIPDAATDLPFKNCPRSDIEGFSHYDMAKVWSRSDVKACNDACPDANDTACVDQKCPGYTQFEDCVNQEINACLTDPSDGPCRTGWENIVCCADAFKCVSSAGDVDSACLDKNCKQYQDDYQQCGKDQVGGSAIQGRCLATGVQACLLPDQDGGTADTGDAGAGDGGTNKSRHTAIGLRSSWVDTLGLRAKLPAILR